MLMLMLLFLFVMFIFYDNNDPLLSMMMLGSRISFCPLTRDNQTTATKL